MTDTRLNIIAALGILVIGSTLWAWGQPLICTCGEIRLWVGSIYDGGNSQHIADWYTLSHFLHGVLIALGARLFFPRVSVNAAFAVAIATGIAWELIEHTDYVLDAFRSTTINQGYHGDSVLNSVADYLWMMGGFFTAWHLKKRVVAALVVALELTAGLIARDSLTLTTLMLVHPVEAVEVWQQKINPNVVIASH